MTLSAASLLALPVAAAEAQPTGMFACDYQPSYRHIPCDTVDRAIHDASHEFRVDDVRMRQIIRCESRFDPFATNGPYRGLFQQSTSYWDERVADFNAHVDPDVSGDIHSPADNARVSARMFAASGDRNWPSC